MQVAIVLNGDPPDAADLRRLDACGAVLCADGAAAALREAGRRPTAIVGDLDSLDADTHAWALREGIAVERHPAHKDDTDGELALARALGLGATSVLVLGGHGRRSAMFLANLKLLRRCHARGVPARMVGRGETLRFVGAGEEARLDDARPGDTLNLLAVDGDAAVDLEGTDWDGDVLLPADGARGVSNRVRAADARVRVRRGLVLIVVEAQGR